MWITNVLTDVIYKRINVVEKNSEKLCKNIKNFKLETYCERTDQNKASCVKINVFFTIWPGDNHNYKN